MKTFRTEINIEKSKNEIKHGNNLLLLGSCFASSIGKKLEDSKYNCIINPFGTIFNPFSISNSINNLIKPENFNYKKALFKWEEKWYSWFHGNDFYDKNRISLKNSIETKLTEANDFLKKTDILFLTVGTSWVYEEIRKKIIVSNCHKVPQNNFLKRRMSVNEVFDLLSNTFNNLLKFNKNIRIIATVSPIRHWKDGAHENQLSKSVLLLAIDELVKKNDFLEYFPSYELMLDDLRDYRYYDEDMIHLSNTAIDYIWGKFSSAYFSDYTIDLNNKISQILKNFNHKIIDINDKKTIDFALYSLKKINELQSVNTEINFEREIAYFENIIKNNHK